MKKSEKMARRLVRQANGLSPGFRYFDNPYEGATAQCPHCRQTIAAGLETCPECGQALPGQYSREPVKKSPPTLLLIAALLVLLGLGLYFFIRAMIESGFIALLTGP